MDIRIWMSNKLKAQKQFKNELLHSLIEWDNKAECGLLDAFDIDKREEWLVELYTLEQMERDDLKQISRVRWAIEGDENTRFFHSLLRNKYANFYVKGIFVNEVWCESPNGIKHADVEHFAARFKERTEARLKFVSSLFRKLSYDDSTFLESNISMEEIKSTVWSCASSKAPGPYGLNFNFIKSYWEVIKNEFFNCIKYLEATRILANGCNPSFIVLIPKKRPLGFSNYRPISLIGYVYKVIFKVLALRLAKVIPTVISPNQTAFLAGRQILDGCLIANEIIRVAKMENHKLLLFKVDFEKAFDNVCWELLFDVMA
ncbi:RNA-directed DNA polymerase, eukaryota [Tanacetum coccineum]